jgi:hypothetical protein
MARRGTLLAASMTLMLVLLGIDAPTAVAAPQPARKIPGINVADVYPQGCVDCHVAKPSGSTVDARLSLQLKAWTSGKVDAALLARVQGSAPPSLKLKGKHPAADDSLEDIPAACTECHTDDSKKAPPLAAMVHRIHLTGGEQNKFMTTYQGECTHCHKLNAATGVWSVPSAAEKQ